MSSQDDAVSHSWRSTDYDYAVPPQHHQAMSSSSSSSSVQTPNNFRLSLSLSLLSGGVLLQAASCLRWVRRTNIGLSVTPKTFHSPSRSLHGPGISVIGHFLLWD